VVDHLRDGVSLEQQTVPMEGGARGDLAIRLSQGPQRLDELVEEERDAVVDSGRGIRKLGSRGYSLSAAPDDLVAVRRDEIVEHRRSFHVERNNALERGSVSFWTDDWRANWCPSSSGRIDARVRGGRRAAARTGWSGRRCDKPAMRTRMTCPATTGCDICAAGHPN